MPEQPTAEQWEKHRPLITKLYTTRTLKHIKDELYKRHGFYATERMYKGRFKTWGIGKNKKRKPFEASLPRDVDLGSNTAAAPPSDISSPTSPIEPASCFSPALTPGESPHGGHRVFDARSTTYVDTPRPGTLPPTPATYGYSSPFEVSQKEASMTPDMLCKEIVTLATLILSKLVSGRPPTLAWDDYTPKDDHLAIYRTLQKELKHESHLRGCLVNNPSVAVKSRMNDHVNELLKSFHPAVPIGILSSFNQSSDTAAINELAHCLVTSSTAILPRDHEFVQLAQRVEQLLTNTLFSEFKACMERICDDLQVNVLKVLGRWSLVMIYLIFVLNAKKAKDGQQTDPKILNMALERYTHVQCSYSDDPKLIVQFGHFILGYYVLVASEAELATSVRDMAEQCYNRAEAYLSEQESSPNSKYADIQDAKSHFGKACAVLADCRYAQGSQQADKMLRDEIHDWSRRLLLVSIGCHVDTDMATMAQFERQKKKLEGWCRDAGDLERQKQLDCIRDLILGNEQRPRDGPLLPRLKVLAGS
ncbi:hypothetical protein CABS01_10492 [Colletotrichum abscissum]|uniref:Clr5 domain-containing protein n=1 Tax=Colletotrichum abscissum TaxID=1671311 RepID=A0A9Q0AZX0_9PEZI|nr:uncharacterized protein CABS01_10492 [Colletotrichum abscissum]KAI3550048.1 hypothetical protein CABS02_07736 [Colletotrichum abscissum]KAK1498717.1 hypothetical protein CABS01_10492 [Colletotrichum abscissum]